MEGAVGDQYVVELSSLELWLSKVQEELDAAAAETRRNPTIFRVPAHLRDQDDDAYEPELISFGPYHHGKEKLKVMEVQKRRSLHKFLKRDQSKDLRHYISRMKVLEARARDCYSEDITTMDSNEFALMFLLDGSFLVECLLSNSMDYILEGHLYRDVLKLENQVPYFILEELYSDLDSASLAHCLNEVFTQYNDELRLPDGCSKPDMFPHVLCLYHYYLCQTTTQHGPTEKCYNFGLIMKMVSFPFSCIISLFFRNPPNLKTIWNARELHEAGVKFSPNDSGNFTNITFSDGVLHMTPVHLYDNSNCMFRNLMALEQCNSGVYGLRITDYTIFMQELVRSSEDLMLLQKAGVLINHLGSEEEAFNFFSIISKEVMPSEDSSFKQTLDELSKYCNSKWPRWRSTLKRKYFSNPWASLSFLAAVTLLILTMMQTILAILSYKEQLNSGSNPAGKQEFNNALS